MTLSLRKRLNLKRNKTATTKIKSNDLIRDHRKKELGVRFYCRKHITENFPKCLQHACKLFKNRSNVVPWHSVKIIIIR